MTPSSVSEGLYERARRVIPGGVNSPVRAFGSVGGTPRFLRSGSGCRVVDADGATYIDYVMSWGPLILGHAHPDVLAAAHAALDRGSSYGAPTEGETELAETIAGAVPGVEMVRAVSSGTEAVMSAVRLARGATGRGKVVKFAGHYHGHSDALLAAAGSGVATLGIPGSPGVTAGATADTLVVAWNDREAVDEAFAEHGDDIAVLVCEPVAANMGVVPPAPGFLEHLRDVTARHGALLAFDEVLTGFRVARGGMTAESGVVPDLVTFGKVVGGGFPLAAFGGSRALMSELAPEGPVYQAGTLSGNPVAVAAGLATLRLLDDAAYGTLSDLADLLVTGLEEAFDDAGVPIVVQRHRSLFSLFFAPPPPPVGGPPAVVAGPRVRDYAAARACDHDRYARFFTGMLERGVHLPPSGYEAVFVSLAHSPDDIQATVEAAREVAPALAG